ncbi:MAG TPA: serine hydrolase domain-containing protein [Vicinamibacteria bacterium]
MTRGRWPQALLPLWLAGCAAARPSPPAPLTPAQIDAHIAELLGRAEVPGLALAVIRDGNIVHQRAYGFADQAARRPLTTDTVLYGASLTKAAFAYLALQLAFEGTLDLDAPLPAQLARPLPEYPEWADLAGDPRWRQITPRMLLSHSSGLLNWRFINDDGKLDIKYPPGSRYVYSGEGIQILQLVVEERTGRGAAELMQERVFDHFGMKDSSLTWRADFEGRTATEYDARGEALGHRRRSRARAAGSMDTTLADYARFVAGVLQEARAGSPAVREMLRPQLRIVSPQQFPSHFPGETGVNAAIELSAGLGWVVYRSPLGPAFFKEGNDDGTNNFVLGFPERGAGLVMLSNSARADRMFFPAAEALLGTTCLPWFWMGYIPYDRGPLRTPAARASPMGPSCLS